VSCYVAQASFELEIICISLGNAGITDFHHCARLTDEFLIWENKWESTAL
jgi:hypothetical protein